jgi:hypothetical protein
MAWQATVTADGGDWNESDVLKQNVARRKQENHLQRSHIQMVLREGQGAVSDRLQFFALVRRHLAGLFVE